MAKKKEKENWSDVDDELDMEMFSIIANIIVKLITLGILMIVYGLSYYIWYMYYY